MILILAWIIQALTTPTREKPSKNGSPKAELHHPENVIYPKSDERILLWQFEEPAERYIMI